MDQANVPRQPTVRAFIRLPIMQDSGVRTTSPVREICSVGSVGAAHGMAARSHRLEDFHEGRRRKSFRRDSGIDAKGTLMDESGTGSGGITRGDDNWLDGEIGLPATVNEDLSTKPPSRRNSGGYSISPGRSRRRR